MKEIGQLDFLCVLSCFLRKMAVFRSEKEDCRWKTVVFSGKTKSFYHKDEVLVLLKRRFLRIRRRFNFLKGRFISVNYRWFYKWLKFILLQACRMLMKNQTYHYIMGSFASHEVNEFATSDISLFLSSRNIKECE